MTARTFHVVYDFQPQAEDFVIAGVFTNASDAEQMVGELKASCANRACGAMPMLMADIELFLLKTRLRELADVLLEMKAAATKSEIVDAGAIRQRAAIPADAIAHEHISARECVPELPFNEM